MIGYTVQQGIDARPFREAIRQMMFAAGEAEALCIRQVNQERCKLAKQTVNEEDESDA